MFDWEDLRYFVTFARVGSLSRAAAELKVDHVTVSRRIVALEAALELKLVDRRPRAYVLTTEGRRVAEMGAQMSESAFRLARFADTKHEDVSGEVVVSVTPAFGDALIAPHIGRLYAQYPKLRLRLVGTKERKSLSRREADISVSFARPDEPTSVAKRLGKMRFSLYASEGWLAGACQPAFVAYDESMKGSAADTWLDACAKGHETVFRSNDLRIQATVAASGVGIVLLPEFLATHHGLRLVDAKGPSLMQDIWLGVHEDVRNAARVKAVIDFIVDCVSPVYSH